MSHDLTAIIVGYAEARNDLQRSLDPRRERFLVISIGQIVAGLRFNAVLVTQSFYDRCDASSLPQRMNFHRWLDVDVSLRCARGAPVVRV